MTDCEECTAVFSVASKLLSGSTGSHNDPHCCHFIEMCGFYDSKELHYVLVDGNTVRFGRRFTSLMGILLSR